MRLRLLLLAALLLPAACSFPKPPTSSSEADVQFQKIIQNEFKYNIILKPAGKTLWVYYPQDKELFSIRRQEQAPPAKNRKFTIAYIDGSFKETAYQIEYDILLGTKSPANKGLSSGYTKEYSEAYRNLIQTVSRIYFDSPDPPEFIIFLLADVKNGVTVKTTFFLEDYRKYALGGLPPEEFSVRVLTEAEGNKTVLDNFTGKDLNFSAVQWPEFLIKQTIQRINFKYQSSDFQPQGDAWKELLLILHETNTIYNFQGYSGAYLHDLRADEKYLFDRAQMEDVARQASAATP